MCVHPGTEVHTDDRVSYRQMDHYINNFNANQVVAHHLNFVDPVTGVHMQEIESCWNKLKLGQQTCQGVRRDDMQAYLDEQMWRQGRAGAPQQVMQNFLLILVRQYLVNNPLL